MSVELIASELIASELIAYELIAYELIAYELLNNGLKSAEPKVMGLFIFSNMATQKMQSFRYKTLHRFVLN